MDDLSKASSITSICCRFVAAYNSLYVGNKQAQSVNLIAYFSGTNEIIDSKNMRLSVQKLNALVENRFSASS